MVVMFLAMLMIVVLFLISSFYLWFTNNNESVFDQFTNFLSLELSGFWLRVTGLRGWRSASFLVLFILVLGLEVTFFIRFSFFVHFISVSLSSWFFSSAVSTVSSSLLLSSFFLFLNFLGCFSWRILWFGNNRYGFILNCLNFLRFNNTLSDLGFDNSWLRCGLRSRFISLDYNVLNCLSFFFSFKIFQFCFSILLTLGWKWFRLDAGGSNSVSSFIWVSFNKLSHIFFQF